MIYCCSHENSVHFYRITVKVTDKDSEKQNFQSGILRSLASNYDRVWFESVSVSEGSSVNSSPASPKVIYHRWLNYGLKRISKWASWPCPLHRPSPAPQHTSPIWKCHLLIGSEIFQHEDIGTCQIHARNFFVCLAAWAWLHTFGSLT